MDGPDRSFGILAVYIHPKTKYFSSKKRASTAFFLAQNWHKIGTSGTKVAQDLRLSGPIPADLQNAKKR